MAYAERSGGAWARHPLSVIGPALLAAGPTFLIAMTVLELSLKFPAAIPVDVDQISGTLFMLIPATIVGGMLALLPTLIGTLALSSIARTSAWAASLPGWVASGTVAGAGLVLAFGADLSDPQGGVAGWATVTTSAVCAGLCWWRARAP